MLHQIPDSYDDLAADAERCAPDVRPFRELDVKGVGIVLARPPMPHAAEVLGAATQSKMAIKDQMDHISRFVINHTADGEFERILAGMMAGGLPADTMRRVVRAITTWGTGRPIGPSSRSRG